LLLLSRTPGEAGGAIGLLTLEDVIEEIISEEIVDETDRYEDNIHKKRAKRITSADVMRGIVERRARRAASITAIPVTEYTYLVPASPAQSDAGTDYNGHAGRNMQYGSFLSAPKP